MLTYARHAQAGRFPYQRISLNNIELPQAAAGRRRRADQGHRCAGTWPRRSTTFNPQNPDYQKLKAALAEMRGSKTQGGPREEIADGPVLKFANKSLMEDSRVPMLRKRLGVAGDGPASTTPSSPRR